MLKKLLLLALATGAVAAAAAWPRLAEVETGRTPDYPDLQDRVYPAPPVRSAKAADDAVRSLPGWSLVGSGAGPAGSEVRARRAGPVPLDWLGYDVVVRIRREGAGSRVGVRSRTRSGFWDFGRNARIIRELQADLDRVLGAGRTTPKGVN
jgi:hypothetical protein